MKKSLLSSLLVATTLFLSGCSAPSADSELADVSATNGWVRYSEYSDHVDGMTGAFAQFTNNTDHVVTILGGSAEIATMVETHEVVMVDGAMKMQAKKGGIQIQPGETLTLEPGGLHIMLMGLKKAVLEGDEVTLTVDFDGTEDQTFTWPVKTSLAGDETYEPKK
ncbi:MAG: copper chaperone PCu(A)C [Micrococcales bacterium]